jgi:hypothetical protein
MTKKPVEPDEMRMPAEAFDTLMRSALGVVPSAAADKSAMDARERPKQSDKVQEARAKPRNRSPRA